MFLFVKEKNVVFATKDTLPVEACQNVEVLVLLLLETMMREVSQMFVSGSHPHLPADGGFLLLGPVAQ